MTTINNDQSLIEKVGGIEMAREIIAGAHWENISYSNGSYYSHSCGKKDICLDDLRTAIAKHDEDHCNHEWNDMTSNGDKYRSLVCKHCDSTKNYLPLDEDHVTDIRNHVSPSTIVKDLEAERHG